MNPVIVEGKRGMKTGGGGLDGGDFLPLALFSRMFGFYQVNVCDAEDDTFYCNFSRMFQMFFMVVFLLGILYFGYKYLSGTFNMGRLKGGSRRGRR